MLVVVVVVVVVIMTIAVIVARMTRLMATIIAILGRGYRATSLSHAIIHALEKTSCVIAVGTVCRCLAIQGAIRKHGYFEMVACLVKAKLRLYRSTVNAICVQTLTRRLGERHVFLSIFFRDGESDLHVHRCNKLGV